MTTEVEARDALVAHLNAGWLVAYPAMTLYYENTVAISLDDAGSAFATASVDFTDSVRMDIDERPSTRSYGVLTLRIFTKEGEGSRSTLVVAGFIRSLLAYRKLGGVTTGCVRPGKKVSKDGWASADWITPFEFFQ